MNLIQNLIPSDEDAFESEDALRRVYGDDAVFSRVGVFTLVHLDSPMPETIARRTSEFDPREFFVDDCPLCQASRSHGGHIVFSDSTGGEDDDECEEEAVLAPVYAATPLKAPAVELLKALDRLDVAADELVCELEPIAAADLLKRTIEDVGFLHDRFVESMWAEETVDRLEVFEQQLTRALTTLELVFAAHADLGPVVRRVEVSLETIAGIWRGL